MMSLKTLGAEVSSSMGGPALGGTIGNTLAELPTAATATASFETMVSGAMKSADGEGKLTTPISGVVPTIVVVEVPLRIQDPLGRATATVTESSPSESLQNSGESELGWVPVEPLVDRAESPSVRSWMPSPSVKKSTDPVPSNDSTGSEAPSFEGATAGIKPRIRTCLRQNYPSQQWIGCPTGGFQCWSSPFNCLLKSCLQSRIHR